MTLRSRTFATAMLALSLVAACDGQPGSPTALEGPAVNGLETNPPGREDAGFLSFTYSGDENGRYFAFGEPTGSSGSIPTGENFAAARHYVIGTPATQRLGTSISSTDRSGGGLSDGVHLQFPGPLRTGTFVVGSCGRGGPFCPAVNIVLDSDNSVDGGGAQVRYFSLTSGTITIDSIEDGRIRGTFEGTAVGETGQFVVTDGRFDVPVTEVDLTAG